MADNTSILSLNRFDAAASSSLPTATAALLERRQKAFGASSVLFYREPLHVVRAEGVWIFTADGRRFLDLYNNVPSVGHCHPAVVDAVARQMARLNTNTRYLYDSIHDYAERLLATFPDSLSNVVFTCTGSESNDLALRIASATTAGSGFVVTQAAYHGNTAAVTEVSPASFKQCGTLPPHVRAVSPPAPHQPGDDIGQSFAASVERAIDDLERQGVRFAGLLVDTIFSSDGIFADPPGFLAPAIALTRERGGVFIADEVQPGFGRTGSMWGFARHGITPDIATLGKPMGNGYPIGGVITRPDLLDRFAASVDYFNTFGGSPCAAAAGLAVLDVIEREQLMRNAEEVGAYLRTGLCNLQSSFPVIADVRGAGLFLAAEFGDTTYQPGSTMASFAVDALRDRGILVGIAGSRGNSLKIRPPLTFSSDDADHFLSVLHIVLDEAATKYARVGE